LANPAGDHDVRGSGHDVIDIGRDKAGNRVGDDDHNDNRKRAEPLVGDDNHDEQKAGCIKARQEQTVTGRNSPPLISR